MKNLLLTITAGGEDGKELILFIGDSYFTERQMAVIDEFLSLSGNKSRLDAPEEGDIRGGGDSKLSMTVGGGSKGKVCECEEYSSLHTATSIQVTGFDAHLCTGISLTDIYDFYAIESGKLIMEEEFFQGDCIHRLMVLFPNDVLGASL